jgi:hypothetical protein
MAILKSLAVAAVLALSVTAAGAVCDDFDEEKALAAAKEEAAKQAQTQATQPTAPAKEATAPAASPPAATDVATADPKPAPAAETPAATVRR